MLVCRSEKKLYLDRRVIPLSLPLLAFCRFLKGRTAGDGGMERREGGEKMMERRKGCWLEINLARQRQQDELERVAECAHGQVSDRGTSR